MKAPLQVKICGITNPDDAREAIAAGADALGFNLYPGSKRYVPLSELTSWVRSISGALRVGVMVNPTIDEIRAAQPWFDVIQLHGQEPPGICAGAASGGTIWKAFPIVPTLEAAALVQYQADAILIDSAIPGAFGGTGTLIDLDRAAVFIKSSTDLRIWLSGGLNPDNVAKAVEMVRPHGVDVASGVEVPGDPRRKDLNRVRAFIAAAKRGPVPA